MDNTPRETPAPPRRTFFRRIVRVFVRCFQLFVILLALYFFAVLVGLIPVNNDFESTADGIEIIVASTETHGDLILPIRNEIVDWRQHFPARNFAGDTTEATHIVFGWGNKEFYVDTRTWSDMTTGTLFRALFWPSATCMHVGMWQERFIPEDARRTRISDEQYRRLVQFVLGSFRRDETDRFEHIAGGAYGPEDAFYYAEGSYHACNTCNCWVGRALQTAGVRTGWFTPLPKTVYLYMPAPQAN